MNAALKGVEALAGPENPPVHYLLKALEKGDPYGVMGMGMPMVVKGAAFRNRLTGEVAETGAFHDLDELARLRKVAASEMDGFFERWPMEWEDGFVTDKGEFLDRAAALKHAQETMPKSDWWEPRTAVGGTPILDSNDVAMMPTADQAATGLGPRGLLGSREEAQARRLDNYHVQKALLGMENGPEFAGRSWNGWPWDEYSQERPRPKDTAPSRNPAGDFTVYHGTSGENAQSILREMLLRPDDIGKVGVGTTPEAVSIYGHIRGRKEPTVLEMLLDGKAMEKYRLEHEGGGSGFNQFLMSPESGVLRDWEGVPLKGARVVKRSGEAVSEPWLPAPANEPLPPAQVVPIPDNPFSPEHLVKQMEDVLSGRTGIAGPRAGAGPNETRLWREHEARMANSELLGPIMEKMKKAIEDEHSMKALIKKLQEKPGDWTSLDTMDVLQHMENTSAYPAANQPMGKKP